MNESKVNLQKKKVRNKMKILVKEIFSFDAKILFIEQK